MSCKYCEENCCSPCLSLSDACPTGGTRFIGNDDSSTIFEDVAIPLCAGAQFFTLTVAITEVTGPTGATGTFTLVKAGLSSCTTTIGQVKLTLTVQVPLIEGAVKCVNVRVPARTFPIEKVALLVESTNPAVSFFTQALLC